MWKKKGNEEIRDPKFLFYLLILLFIYYLYYLYIYYFFFYILFFLYIFISLIVHPLFGSVHHVSHFFLFPSLYLSVQFAPYSFPLLAEVGHINRHKSITHKNYIKNIENDALSSNMLLFNNNCYYLWRKSLLTDFNFPSELH